MALSVLSVAALASTGDSYDDSYDDSMMDTGMLETDESEESEESEDLDDGTMDSGMAETETFDDGDTGFYSERQCPRFRVVSCCDDNDLQAYATAEGIPLEEADPYMCADDLLEQALVARGSSMQGVFDNPEAICNQTCAPLAATETTWADANQYSDTYTSPSCDSESSRTVIDVECYAVTSP